MSKVFSCGNVVTAQDMTDMWKKSHDAESKSAVAVDNANQAVETSNQAKSIANDAATRADAAAKSANTAVTNAINAAESANAAATSANVSAASATSSAASANNALVSATSAALAADNAKIHAENLKKLMGDRLTAVETSNAEAVANVNENIEIVKANIAKTEANIAKVEENNIKTESNIAKVEENNIKTETNILKVNGVLTEAKQAVSQVQSAIVNAEKAKSDAATAAWEVKAIKNEAVNLYNQQYVSGKKIFKEIFAGNYSLRDFVYLGNNSCFADFGDIEDICMIGDYYYLTVYDKKLLNGTTNISRPSIVKYNYKTKKVEKLFKIETLKYKNSIVGQICVKENGELYVVVLEHNGEKSGVEKYFLFKYDPHGTSEDLVGYEYKDKDGNAIAGGLIRAAYDYAIVGEGENARLYKQYKDELYMTDGQNFYKAKTNDLIFSLLCKLPEGYNVNNLWTIMLDQVWFVKTDNNDNQKKLFRYEYVCDKMRSTNFPDNDYIVGMSEDVELGYIYFFGRSNKIYNTSIIIPLTVSEFYYTQNASNRSLAAYYACKGEIYLLTRPNDSDDSDISCNLAHLNIVDKQSISIFDLELNKEKNTKLFIGEDEGIIIKNGEGIKIYSESLSVQQYMDELNLKYEHLNGLVGNTINSDYRYIELKENINDLETTAVRKNDYISLLNNDREFQTKTDVSTAIYNALEDYTPSSGGGSGETLSRVVWEGRVREDSIYDMIVKDFASSTSIIKNKIHVWEFSPLQYFDFKESDKIKIYLETNEITTSNIETPFVDKVELLYECAYFDTVNVKDLDSSYTGEDFNVAIGEFVLSASEFKTINQNYSAVYRDNMPGNSFGFDKNFVFGDFAKIIVSKNMDKYLNFLVSNGASTDECSEMSDVYGKMSSNCRLYCERLIELESYDTFWNYETDISKSLRTAVARIDKPFGELGSYTVYATMNLNVGQELPCYGENYFYHFTKMEVVK